MPKKSNPFEATEKQILELVFKKKSRTELTRILRKSKNYFNLLDKNKATFYWADFLKIAEILELDVATGLHSIFYFQHPLKHIHLLINNLFSLEARLNEIAKILDISRSSAHRILVGEQDLRFQQFLQIINHYGSCDSFFRAIGLKITRHQPTKKQYYETERNKLLSEIPEFFIIVNCREIGMTNIVETLVEHLPLSREHISFLVRKLEEIETLPRLDSTDNEINVIEAPEKSFLLRQLDFLHEVAKKDLRAYQTEQRKERFHYFQANTCSEEAYERIKKEYENTFLRVSEITNIDAQNNLPKVRAFSWLHTMHVFNK